MKIARRIVGILLLVPSALALSSTCLASNSTVSPLYDPGLVGLNYNVSTENTGITQIDWSHEAYNLDSDEADSVTRTVTREQFFEGTVSGSGEVSALLAGVKMSAEVSFGTTTTTSTSRTYTIDARSAFKCVYGSKICKTSGYMETWTNGKKTDSRLVSATYTYEEYSDKIKIS